MQSPGTSSKPQSELGYIHQYTSFGAAIETEAAVVLAINVAVTANPKVKKEVVMMMVDASDSRLYTS
eukprot:m.214881 g.214881  ORF g.214881 m.214881 type:complete len:67 (+) comp33178_c0_seq1:1867-2067(+)